MEEVRLTVRGKSESERRAFLSSLSSVILDDDDEQEEEEDVVFFILKPLCCCYVFVRGESTRKLRLSS